MVPGCRRRAMAPWGVALVAFTSGCAVHLTGVVSPAAPGARLVTQEGKEYRLVLSESATPLRRLDGHFVRLDGRAVFRAVRVTDWDVLEGLHGLSTWVGPLRAMGSQLGVEDRRSGSFYWVDDASADALRDQAGAVVLLEGYVDGPHRLKVLYYRLLE